jgi:hypothetical protein
MTVFFENYNVLREIILRHFYVKAGFMCCYLYQDASHMSV